MASPVIAEQGRSETALDDLHARPRIAVDGANGMLAEPIDYPTGSEQFPTQGLQHLRHRTVSLFDLPVPGAGLDHSTVQDRCVFGVMPCPVAASIVFGRHSGN